jgi:hypothetical protein
MDLILWTISTLKWTSSYRLYISTLRYLDVVVYSNGRPVEDRLTCRDCDEVLVPSLPSMPTRDEREAADCSRALAKGENPSTLPGENCLDGAGDSDGTATSRCLQMDRRVRSVFIVLVLSCTSQVRNL